MTRTMFTIESAIEKATLELMTNLGTIKVDSSSVEDRSLSEVISEHEWDQIVTEIYNESAFWILNSF